MSDIIGVLRDGVLYLRTGGEGNINPDYDALKLLGKNSVAIAIYDYNMDFIVMSNMNLYTLTDGKYTPISKSALTDVTEDYVDNQDITPKKSSGKFITDNNNPVTLNVYGGTFSAAFALRYLMNSPNAVSVFCSAPKYGHPNYTKYVAEQFPEINGKTPNMLIEFSFENPVKDIRKIEWNSGTGSFLGRYPTDFEIFVDRKSVFKGTEQATGTSTGSKSSFSYEW